MKFERWPDGTYRCGSAVIEEVLRRHDYGYEGERWTLRINGKYVGGFRTLAQAKKRGQLEGLIIPPILPSSQHQQ